jgi:hypothetical protein
MAQFETFKQISFHQDTLRLLKFGSCTDHDALKEKQKEEGMLQSWRLGTNLSCKARLNLPESNEPRTYVNILLILQRCQKPSAASTKISEDYRDRMNPFVFSSQGMAVWAI